MKIKTYRMADRYYIEMIEAYADQNDTGIMAQYMAETSENLAYTYGGFVSTSYAGEMEFGEPVMD
jgi:hypothetical protein